jgi:hypothetical protein
MSFSVWANVSLVTIATLPKGIIGLIISGLRNFSPFISIFEILYT